MLIHKIDVFPHSVIDKIKLKADDSSANQYKLPRVNKYPIPVTVLHLNNKKTRSFQPRGNWMRPTISSFPRVSRQRRKLDYQANLASTSPLVQLAPS